MAKGKPTRVTTEQRHRAALLHAVAKHTTKYATRAHLAAGVYDVKARISGSVDGIKLAAESIAGTLMVDSDSERAGYESADVTRLIAYLLRSMPRKTADRVYGELPKSWRSELEQLPAQDLDAADSLLRQLRFEGPAKTVRGSVKFLKAG